MSTAAARDPQQPASHDADSHDLIRVQGARENNLKDVSIELPKRRLTVFTGVSGSGKSSLLDAITWALWGRARGKRDEELVHLGQNDMHVQLDFEHEGAVYRVLRQRTRKGRVGPGKGASVAVRRERVHRVRPDLRLDPILAQPGERLVAPVERHDVGLPAVPIALTEREQHFEHQGFQGEQIADVRHGPMIVSERRYCQNDTIGVIREVRLVRPGLQ